MQERQLVPGLRACQEQQSGRKPQGAVQGGQLEVWWSQHHRRPRPRR
jgi:hypothetical protein